MGVESCKGSLAWSFFLMAAARSSIASMPGASSQPQVAARQLLKQRSRFWRPVANVLILTGGMLTDQGMAELSGSFGPGFTAAPNWASAGAALSRVLFTQPTAHGRSVTAHFFFFFLSPAIAKKLADFFSAAA